MNDQELIVPETYTGPFPWLDRLESIFAMPITAAEQAAAIRKLIPATEADQLTWCQTLVFNLDLSSDGQRAAAGAAADYLLTVDDPRLIERVSAAADFLARFCERLLVRPEAVRGPLLHRVLKLLPRLQSLDELTALERSLLVATVFFIPEADCPGKRLHAEDMNCP